MGVIYCLSNSSMIQLLSILKRKEENKMPFLPVTMEEVKERGWEQLDFVYICGDAYVDHPSFGAAIICRTLENAGYKVGIIPQPDWNKKEDFMKLLSK